MLDNESLKKEMDIVRRKSNEDNNKPLIEAANQINSLKKEIMKLTRSNETQEKEIEKAMKEFEPLILIN